MLEAIARLDADHPIDLVHTFLGAHAIPAEYKGRADAYTNLVVNEMLPAVLEFGMRSSEFRIPNSPFVDVFCEDGAFTLDQSRRVLEKATELGFALKIHVDEFEPLGGTRLGVELGAISVDHVVTTPAEEIELLGNSRTIAVLPGAHQSGAYCTPAKAVCRRRALALATDLNPGTTWVKPANHCGAGLPYLPLSRRRRWRRRPSTPRMRSGVVTRSGLWKLESRPMCSS
jgi:imidazolonepropionase